MTYYPITARRMVSVPDDILAAMRSWVSDCQWSEDEDELDSLTNTEVVRGVERHYHGGIAQFVLDCIPGPANPVSETSHE